MEKQNRWKSSWKETDVSQTQVSHLASRRGNAVLSRWHERAERPTSEGVAPRLVIVKLIAALHVLDSHLPRLGPREARQEVQKQLTAQD